MEESVAKLLERNDEKEVVRLLQEFNSKVSYWVVNLTYNLNLDFLSEESILSTGNLCYLSYP